MIKLENIEVFNFKGAIRGMRNPLESWLKSDSKINFDGTFQLGPNDLGLMRRLFLAGKDHRKFTRQILISFDVTAPLYWFKEFDTYKVGTTANSTSTMHKIHSKVFTKEMFVWNPVEDSSTGDLIQLNRDNTLYTLNKLRETYLETKDKEVWKLLIQTLPDSFIQKRHITCNYEVIYNMYFSRVNHKLTEWKEFCKVMSTELPYFKEIAEIED